MKTKLEEMMFNDGWKQSIRFNAGKGNTTWWFVFLKIPEENKNEQTKLGERRMKSPLKTAKELKGEYKKNGNARWK